MLQRKENKLDNNVLAEIAAALGRVGNQAICVAGIVRGALGQATNLRNNYRMKRLLNTYGHMVRIHSKLFELIYNAELKSITAMIEEPTVQELLEFYDPDQQIDEDHNDDDVELVHRAPSPEPPPSK